MTETILLVDYENVRDTGLKSLPPHDRAILFVGKGQKPKLAFIQDHLAQETRLDLIQIAEQGRNNLDFYIAFYLGKIMSEEQGANYIVFSNDQDLDPLIAHLKKRGISCSRMGVPRSSPAVKTATPAPQKAAAPKLRQRKAPAPKPEKSPEKDAAQFLAKAGKRQPKAKDALVNSLMNHLKQDKLAIERIIEDLIEARVIAISKTNRVTYL
jgi:hypothetical protein